MEDQDWYRIDKLETIATPALIVSPKRIVANIKKMIQVAGSVNRLRPHIKTHKVAEIIRLQLEYGIQKFKCATIKEAQLLAESGAPDILLALQPVGYNILQYFELIEAFPDSDFSTIVDSKDIVNHISKIAKQRNIKVSLWLDVNNGMNRTGIVPGEKAIIVYEALVKDPYIEAKGLHVYDGHIHESDLELRTKQCNTDFESVRNLKHKLIDLGIEVPKIIAGGTPTFPIHTKRKDVELSPGTPLLWDAGYSNKYRDLDFLPAAVLVTRVVSKPTDNLVCFDLGHKSVASEMPLPRIQFLDETKGVQISQSEEHLVVELDDRNLYCIGETAFALPKHVCPTVAKYKTLFTVEDREIVGSWEVQAREHN